MARNAPGSFALFGGAAAVYEYFYHLKDHRDATLLQNSIASVVGSVSSIIVSAPLDVIKTRIQKADFDKQQSGITIMNNLIKEEGPSALFKGLTPKILVVAPKLIFSFTIAQWLIAKIEKSL
jgi:hypothetical protein